MTQYLDKAKVVQYLEETAENMRAGMYPASITPAEHFKAAAWGVQNSGAFDARVLPPVSEEGVDFGDQREMSDLSKEMYLSANPSSENLATWIQVVGDNVERALSNRDVQAVVDAAWDALALLCKLRDFVQPDLDVVLQQSQDLCVAFDRFLDEVDVDELRDLSPEAIKELIDANDKLDLLRGESVAAARSKKVQRKLNGEEVEKTPEEQPEKIDFESALAALRGQAGCVIEEDDGEIDSEDEDEDEDEEDTLH